MLYVINTAYDYADEFDYPVFSIMTEKERADLIASYETWKDFDFTCMYFGSNEYIDFEAEDILDLIINAKAISKKDYKKFKFLTPETCLDIIYYVKDMLEDHRDN